MYTFPPFGFRQDHILSYPILSCPLLGYPAAMITNELQFALLPFSQDYIYRQAVYRTVVVGCYQVHFSHGRKYHHIFVGGVGGIGHGEESDSIYPVVTNHDHIRFFFGRWIRE